MSKELEVFNPLKSEITEYVAPVLSITVSDFKSSQAALEVAKTLKGYSKTLDAKRRELVDPLNAQVKAINDYVKQLGVPLDQAEAHVKNQLNAFAAEQEKLRQAELRKAEEEYRKQQAELKAKHEAEQARVAEGASIFGAGDETDTQAVVEAQTQEAAHLKHDFEVKKWDVNQQQIKNTRRTTKCRVTDITKVPREYLIIELNDKMCIAAYKGGVKQIPGVEFYEEVGVAIGAKTRVTKASLETERKNGQFG